MKIVYIAGDGRSGSTLLESILTNADNTVGIGEGYRFWKRYYEGDTQCGCSKMITECELWPYVHHELVSKIEGYDASDFWRRIQFLLQFKNARRIPQVLKEEDWQPFAETVKLFYQSIADRSQKEVLIDSSKSIGWLQVLLALDFCEVTVLHLERKLPAVANSWKKKVKLPEYPTKNVYMPVKGNWEITKNWLKIKYFMRRFRHQTSYTFIPYESFIYQPEAWKDPLELWCGSKIDLEKLTIPFNHAIGGNPMRSNTNGALKIRKEAPSLNELSGVEKIYFKFVYSFAKLFL
ncbi:MAG: hypothetical protein KTR22_11935 [Flavobacteriaceae bacterium]|nr:hypothetical protein [Flavobacteriaceae bacterium]